MSSIEDEITEDSGERDEPQKTHPFADIVEGPQPPEDDPQQRALECNTEIQNILTRYRCVLIPRLTWEPVGQGGWSALATATYGVIAETSR